MIILKIIIICNYYFTPNIHGYMNLNPNLQGKLLYLFHKVYPYYLRLIAKILLLFHPLNIQKDVETNLKFLFYQNFHLNNF